MTTDCGLRPSTSLGVHARVPAAESGMARRSALLGALGLCAPWSAFGADDTSNYLERAVTLSVGFPPGGYFVFMTLGGPVMGMIKTGKLKAIGYAASARNPDLPEVPTLNETKLVNNLSYDLWAGLLVAKTMPDAIVRKVSAAMNEAFKQPQLRSEIEASGVTFAAPMTLEEAAHRYADDIAKHRAIAQYIQLQPE